MKKLLIATSAVVGLGLVSADFASAQVETTLSGVVQIRIKDESKTDTAQTYVNRAQLQWDAKGTSDSGLTYGARIRLRPTGKVTTDVDGGQTVEIDNGRHLTYVYFGGGFGQVTLGNQTGVGASAFAGSGNAGAATGGFDGSTMEFDGAGKASYAGVLVDGTDSSREDKISYASPSFGGANVYVDYYMGSGTKDTGSYSAAVKYSGSMDDVSFNVAAGIRRSDTTSTTNHGGSNLGFGADVTFGAITVGASYVSKGKSGASKDHVANALKGGQNSMSLAMKYNFGAGNVSLGYGTSKADVYGVTAAETTTDKKTTINVGVDYTVAPGWSVYAEASRNKDTVDATNVSTTNNVWILGTNVAF